MPNVTRVALMLQVERVGAAEAAAQFVGTKSPKEFLQKVVQPMLAMEGDKLPVR